MKKIKTESHINIDFTISCFDELQIPYLWSSQNKWVSISQLTFSGIFSLTSYHCPLWSFITSNISTYCIYSCTLVFCHLNFNCNTQRKNTWSQNLLEQVLRAFFPLTINLIKDLINTGLQRLQDPKTLYQRTKEGKKKRHLVLTTLLSFILPSVCSPPWIPTSILPPILP